ncbi:DUF2624 domain-containing protein [Bacillus sp. UMB0728]|nr:DUF2624 domain-containing protein [Bacillus sp. UMB0728]
MVQRRWEKMKIFENIINHKVSTITTEELLKYAKQFQISINQTQAKQIANYLRGKQVNIFQDSERSKIIKEIAKIAGSDTAREVNKLFMQFTK